MDVSGGVSSCKLLETVEFSESAKYLCKFIESYNQIVTLYNDRALVGGSKVLEDRTKKAEVALKAKRERAEVLFREKSSSEGRLKEEITRLGGAVRSSQEELDYLRLDHASAVDNAHRETAAALFDTFQNCLLRI